MDRHVILTGTTKTPNGWSGEYENVEFYQLPKIMGTAILFDGDGGVCSGCGYKNLASARSACSKVNPKRGGYDFKWTKVAEPLNKIEIHLMRSKADEK